MSNAYGYGRVSTAVQVEEGHSLENQAAAAKGYYEKSLKAQGVAWAGMFVDKVSHAGKRGVSGKTPLSERPAGSKLCSALAKGDHVVMLDLTRGFRNFADAIVTIEGWIKDGVVVHLVRQQINTGTPHGKMVFRLMAMFAEMEREMAAERTREVLEHKRKLGQATGGPAGYGFKYEGKRGERRRVVDDAEMETIQRIDSMHKGGMTYTEIYFTFLREGVKTKGGKTWSRNRIHRAHCRFTGRSPSTQTAGASG